MATPKEQLTFHGVADAIMGNRPAALAGILGDVKLEPAPIVDVERSLAYRFRAHFHPYVTELIHRLIEGSVRGIQAADTDYVKKADGTFETITSADGKKVPTPALYEAIFSKTRYDPSPLVQEPHPVKDLDFTPSGAYSVYNWELFYHVPVTIGIHLSKNQRFEDAQRWFHHVFDPTDDSDGPTPERFWKVRPFQTTDVDAIEAILENLSSGADPGLQADTVNSIEAWKEAPFRPHLVARYRQTAYMWKAVTAYLDNLVDWGDALFRQDTGEAINEATQLYVLAANILGPRPEAVPKRGTVGPRTYADLRRTWDELGNALVDLETDIPFAVAPHPGPATAGASKLGALGSIGKVLYFCVPKNDMLLAYWDTVADRLFKIRNSLNIQGIFRQLPLFEPPIDPALLAKAAAAGLDVGAVVNGLSQPLPLVRFQLLAQKAAEICQEVKALGGHLLSAMEKEDNEAMALLRAGHESRFLALSEAVKYGQLQEATKAREGVEKSLANAAQRYTYYERLLGKQESEIEIPEIEALDVDGLLNKMKFKGAEPEIGLRDVEVDIAGDISGEGGGHKMSTQEVAELLLLKAARGKHDTAAFIDKVGGSLAIIPNFGANIQPFGAGMTISFGGSNLAAGASLTSSFYKSDADKLAYEATKAAKIGSFATREREWAFQSNVAAGEIAQLHKQLRATQIREAVAEREWKNHKQQIENAREIEQFLEGEKVGGAKKTTTRDLYAWMKRDARGLYGKAFQLAFDVAKKAERALQHEIGDPSLGFLQLDYTAGREGLLAGEKLYLDIKRMEMAYHDLNRREYELTKHVSLRELDPRALIQLRATGRCTMTLPDALFDLDGPGHYFRRIRAVAVSIPCVSGPYVSVSATLTLQKSTIRKSPLLGDGYARQGAEDPRFSDHFGSLDAIVTSTAESDSGLFEVNLRDERYLPFEGAGAVSQWQIALPADPSKGEPCNLDYDTISDVVLHLRYTAREGGAELRSAAMAGLTAAIEEATAAGSVQLFSVRHDFPTAWTKLQRATLGPGKPLAALTLELTERHYPFWSRGRLGSVRDVQLFAKTKKSAVEVHDAADGSGSNDILDKASVLGDLLSGKLSNIPLPEPLGELTLYLDDNDMEELWIALTWGA